MIEGLLKFSTLDMEDVGAFHEKSFSGGLYSFRPFNLPLQMLMVTRVNLSILTSM